MRRICGRRTWLWTDQSGASVPGCQLAALDDPLEEEDVLDDDEPADLPADLPEPDELSDDELSDRELSDRELSVDDELSLDDELPEAPSEDVAPVRLSVR